eukprot:tig00021760_g23431.t1
MTNQLSSSASERSSEDHLFCFADRAFILPLPRCIQLDPPPDHSLPQAESAAGAHGYGGAERRGGGGRRAGGVGGGGGGGGGRALDAVLPYDFPPEEEAAPGLGAAPEPPRNRPTAPNTTLPRRRPRAPDRPLTLGGRAARALGPRRAGGHPQRPRRPCHREPPAGPSRAGAGGRRDVRRAGAGGGGGGGGGSRLSSEKGAMLARRLQAAHARPRAAPPGAPAGAQANPEALLAADEEEGRAPCGWPASSGRARGRPRPGGGPERPDPPSPLPRPPPPTRTCTGPPRRPPSPNPRRRAGRPRPAPPPPRRPPRVASIAVPGALLARGAHCQRQGVGGPAARPSS